MYMLVCDNCQTQVGRGESLPPNWFTLSREIQSYGIGHGPWHLCSWKCVERFAGAEAHG